MNLLLKFLASNLFLVFITFTGAIAQSNKQKDVEYLAVVTKRADKIVATLGIADSAKYNRVRGIIAKQYQDLNEVHEGRDAAIKSLGDFAENKKSIEVQKLKETASKDLKKLHTKYLAKLSRELSSDQIERVKDGMTYSVLPITYKGYQEMLPQLSNEQKSQILKYLTEARELAMDAESSEKKHGWFGKYKGKINNYLSSQGINMKQASDDWAKRVKEQQANKK